MWPCDSILTGTAGIPLDVVIERTASGRTDGGDLKWLVVDPRVVGVRLALSSELTG